MATSTFYPEHFTHVISASPRVAVKGEQAETRFGPVSTSLPRPWASVRPVEEWAASSSERIAASDLFADAEGVSPALTQTLRLLSNAVGEVRRALEAAKEDDLIEADLHVQAVRPLLRRLFLYRAIGDGFGAVIDAMISALTNNRGALLGASQLRALDAALGRLHREPFLAFRAAMETIEEFERAGFSTAPPGFEHLAGWLMAEGLP